ncbi:MAG: hypothetical protein FWH17_08195 [Oscillospiraceae bacterium]|nr:hypothetical protein [Oscillospiraceae bacterium]
MSKIVKKNHIYGEFVWEKEPSKTRIYAPLAFIIISLVFPLFLFLVSIVLLIDKEWGVGVTFFVLSALLLVLMLFILVKKLYIPYSITIFKHGIILSKQNKIDKSYDFSELFSLIYSTLGDGRNLDMFQDEHTFLHVQPLNDKKFRIPFNKFYKELAELENNFKDFTDKKNG